jgi:hypothetical protein
MIFHPIELYRFLDAATKSIETDPGFGLPQLRTLASELHGLKAGKVSLLTVPLSNSNAYVDIGGVPASVVYWDIPAADAIWKALRDDAPLPGTRHHRRTSTAGTPTPTPSPTPSLDVLTANRAVCTA